MKITVRVKPDGLIDVRLPDGRQAGYEEIIQKLPKWAQDNYLLLSMLESDTQLPGVGVRRTQRDWFAILLSGAHVNVGDIEYVEYQLESPLPKDKNRGPEKRKKWDVPRRTK